jgi:hypothetical protein
VLKLSNFKNNNEINANRLNFLQEKYNKFIQKYDKNEIPPIAFTPLTNTSKVLENKTQNTPNEISKFLEKAKLRVENLAKNKREREKTEIFNSKKSEDMWSLDNDRDKISNLFSDENKNSGKIKIKKCGEKLNSIFNRDLKVVILKDNHQISLTEWKFNYEENVFGFGMCLKETIVKNNFQIINNKGSGSHGCFIISSTGLLLSSSNEQENLKEVEDFRKPEINEEVRIISHLMVNEIVVRIKEREYKFTKVSLNDKTLVPCKVLIVE